jgi:DNA polymerase-1
MMGSEQRTFIIDFEYASDRTEVHCLCAAEVAPDGTVLNRFRIWRSRLVGHECPFPRGSLLVGYSISGAEALAFRWLGWDPLDYAWIDLYTEFRMRRNIEKAPPVLREDEEPKPMFGFSLVDALGYFGLSRFIPEEKEEQRERAIKGGDFTGEDARALMDYCECDVLATAALWQAMKPEPGRQFEVAKWRGRYSAALSMCCHLGVPIDLGLYNRFLKHKHEWLAEMLLEVDPDHKLWREDASRSMEGFRGWIRGLPAELRNLWPLTDSGDYSLRYDDLKRLGEHYPEIAQVVSMLGTTSKFRRMALDIEPHFGTNAPWFAPFGTKTGRNAPSTNRFAFNLPAYLRCLVSPPTGEMLGYVDWRAQELGIAAKRSGDLALLKAYGSGDVYIANAIAFGWADPGATKESAPEARSKAKVATLGLNYSMGARSLSKHMADHLYEAKIVKQKHHATYRQFYDWTAAHTCKTLDEGSASVLDWKIYTHPRHRPRITTLNNWPVQSTGAVMMRIALVMAVERGVSVRAPVHDAFVFCAPVDEYEDQQRALCESMEEASRIVLDGFTIDADVEKTVKPGQHYIDDRGAEMSRLMMETLDRLDRRTTAA